MRYKDVVDEVDEAQEEPASKSQRKREAAEILDLAESLSQVPDKLYRELRLPEDIREATDLARKLADKPRAHSARKRQLHYLAKRLRSIELSDIYAQLRAIEQRAQQSIQRHKQLESWRDRLIEEGDVALEALLVEYPKADRAMMRQLQRNAQRERRRELPPKSSRSLFRYLQTLL